MNEIQEEQAGSILCLIKDHDIRNLVRDELNNLPEYFWHVPASSSGKYHPSYALGEGGLWRHTLAACKIAIDLFPIYDFVQIERDRILAALLLHDGFKQGVAHTGSGNTVFEHPILMQRYLQHKYVYSDSKPNSWFEHNVYLISDMIARHMGQWNTSGYSFEVLPLPQTEDEKFVHLCDYLASRKDIEVVL